MIDNENIKHFATNIINLEISAIQKLLNYIDDGFADVVKLLYNCKGRVIVTGIGKSAIIGQKIVATFNSTGTPAIFMHAADAIHGDLGIIQEDDVVIFISKSGNTPEIKVLVPLIKKINHKNITVGMIGNENSFLANNCDHIINCSVDTEACPNNLAPTSSTTAQLVMGDAIAITLLNLKGFSVSDFAKVHPGGALGKKLLIKVSDLISKFEKASVTLDSSIEDVILEITSKMVGATAVLNCQGDICGIITDGDIRRMLHRKDDINTIKASSIMNANPKTIDIDDLAINAFAEMEDNKITQLIVTNKANKYCGIIHIHSILREGII